MFDKFLGLLIFAGIVGFMIFALKGIAAAPAILWLVR